MPSLISNVSDVVVARLGVRPPARSRPALRAWLAATAASLALLGCTSGEGLPGADGAAAGNNDEDAGDSDRQQGAEGHEAGGPAPPTPEEYEEQLVVIAEGLRLDDPPEDVAFERYVTPDEWAAVTVACLREKGIGAEETPDGGVAYDQVPPEQAEAQREAAFRCEARYLTHPDYTEPLDDDQVRAVFQHQLGTAECLEAEGYEVDPPPSEDTFVDGYLNPDVVTWSPYSRVDDVDIDEWYRLNEVCPQIPSWDTILGEDASG